MEAKSISEGESSSFDLGLIGAVIGTAIFIYSLLYREISFSNAKFIIIFLNLFDISKKKKTINKAMHIYRFYCFKHTKYK